MDTPLAAARADGATQSAATRRRRPIIVATVVAVVAILAVVAAMTVFREDPVPGLVRGDLEALAAGKAAENMDGWQGFGSAAGLALVPSDVTLTVAGVEATRSKTDDTAYRFTWTIEADRAGSKVTEAQMTTDVVVTGRDDQRRIRIVGHSGALSLEALLPDIASEASATSLVDGMQPRAQVFDSSASLEPAIVPGEPAPAEQVINERTWLTGVEETERAARDGTIKQFVLVADGMRSLLYEQLASDPVGAIVHRGTLNPAAVLAKGAAAFTAFGAAQKQGDIEAVRALVEGAGEMEEGVLNGLKADYVDDIGGTTDRDLQDTGATKDVFRFEGPRDTAVVVDAKTDTVTLILPGLPLRVVKLEAKPVDLRPTPDPSTSYLCKKYPNATVRVTADRILYRLDATPFLSLKFEVLGDGRDCTAGEEVVVTTLNDAPLNVRESLDRSGMWVNLSAGAAPGSSHTLHVELRFTSVLDDGLLSFKVPG